MLYTDYVDNIIAMKEKILLGLNCLESLGEIK